MTPRVIAAIELNRWPLDCRQLPSDHLLAPECALAGSRQYPSAPSQMASPGLMVTLPLNSRLCYRLRCLGGIIWGIPVEMPTLDWIRSEFNYGYDSGDVLSWIPGKVRFREERAIGGSYRKVFLKAIAPYLQPDSRVLELGPGRGSWSRAILKFVPLGELHVVDFRDVRKWLEPERYNGRLVCHHVADNSFGFLLDGYFDFFWSFGVLCHNEVGAIREILANARQKMKPGACSVHQYGDWEKLERYGWARGRVPLDFKNKPDTEIWWPRNDQVTMAKVSQEAGWEVATPDLRLLRRDSLILLRNTTK